MAMVFLTDRKINYDTKRNDNSFNNDLYLIAKFEEEEKIIPQNKPPFNIQGKGHQNFNNILNNNPGPGSYNIENDIIKPQQNSNTNLNFLTNSPRFSKNDLEDSPGPGSYNLYEKPLIRKRLSQRPNSNSSFKYNTHSINNISSIPSKKQLFGYLENEDGELVQAVDPLFEECFSGEKNNSVGPDRYDIQLKEKNPIVNWKRMSARNINIMRNGINLSKNNMKYISKNTINNESIGDISKISKLDTDISFIKNNREINKYKKRVKMRDLMDNYKKKLNSSRIVVSKKQEIEPIDLESELEFLNHAENSITKNKGLVFPINFNKMRYQSKPEEYQFFGSSVERGINKLPFTDRLLYPGPGYYFNEKFKNFKINNRNANNSTFAKSKRVDPFLVKSNSLGPGSYNILKNDLTKKKSFSNLGSFSCEKRFPKIEKAKNFDLNNSCPGPGNYESSILWKKDLKKEIKRQVFVNADQEIKKLTNKKLKEKMPDLYSYQKPGLINIIQSKINSKINPYASQNSPFLSGLGRFLVNKEIVNSTHRGPGTYELSKNIGKYLQNSKNIAPFNSNAEKKMAYLNRSNSCVSPGEYIKDSYFDWNKKSFNIMFS